MKNSLYSAVIFTTLMSASLALVYKDCGSKGSTITSVKVSGCDTDPVCLLHKGTNATVTINFKTSEDFSQAKAVVHGIIAGVPVPFPITQADGCKNCGLTCPIKSGTEQSYHNVIFVHTEYPKLQVVVKWELKDKDGSDIFCMEVPAKVVD